MLSYLQSMMLSSWRAIMLLLLPISGCQAYRLPNRVAETTKCNWNLTPQSQSTTGMQYLSATTQALFSVGVADKKARGYILVARGRANWFEGKLVGGGGHVNGSGAREHSWRIGNLSHKVVFDPDANTVELLGVRVGLDTANVLFLDKVDQIDGDAKIVGTACAKEFDVENADKLLSPSVPKLPAFIKVFADA